MLVWGIINPSCMFLMQTLACEHVCGLHLGVLLFIASRLEEKENSKEKETNKKDLALMLLSMLVGSCIEGPCQPYTLSIILSLSVSFVLHNCYFFHPTISPLEETNGPKWRV